MPIFRRGAGPDPPDPAAEAFGLVADRIDQAQRALLAAIPTSRDRGISLADAIAAFEAGLAEAGSLMPGWRTEANEDLHDRCLQALVDARAEAERLRLEPGALGFEALNARIGDVLHPLENFADAERALRRK